MAIGLMVEPRFHGYRLDRFLAARIQRMSRARIAALVQLGRVTRAGHAASEGALRASHRVREGDALVLWRPALVERIVPRTYEVIAQDDNLLVVDKPSGLPVHPTASYQLNTLTALMRERLGEGHGWQMAHRIDRETSGVLLFGRGRSAAALKRAFAQREIDKTYLAIVHGEVRAPLSIDLALGSAKDSAIMIKMGPRALCDGGRPAQTEVTPLAIAQWRGAPVTLVRCEPKTGRQHQIRVHLHAMGHPVVGDKLYGSPETAYLAALQCDDALAALEADVGLCRHALHAYAVRLQHPTLGRRCGFVSPWPPELAAIVPLPASLKGGVESLPPCP